MKADYAKAFGTAVLRGVKKAIMAKPKPKERKEGDDVPAEDAEAHIVDENLPWGDQAWTPECEVSEGKGRKRERAPCLCARCTA